MTAQKIVLHIGAHKTASTLLQRALKSDLDQLASDGVKVIFRDETLKTPLMNVLTRVLKGESVGPASIQKAQAAYQEMARSGADTVLITSEDLVNRLQPGYFFDQVDAALSILMDIVGVKPRVILYTRNQPDLIESLYIQMVHVGQESQFADFLNSFNVGTMSWLEVADRIAAVIGKSNLTMFPYETIKKIGATGYYQNFLKAVGVEDTGKYEISEDFANSGYANRSYSALAIEIARIVNPLLNDQEKRALRGFLQSKFSTATHPKADLINKDQRREILTRQEINNRKVFEKFMSAEIDHLLLYCGSQTGL